MKKNTVIALIVGFVLGIIFTLVVCYVISTKTLNNTSQLMPGLTLFKEGQHGDIFSEKQLKIFQVLPPNVGLATLGEDIFGIVVLYIGNEEDNLYDNQIIKVPQGKKFIQVGTYQYTNNSGIQKTVPVVKIR